MNDRLKSYSKPTHWSLSGSPLIRLLLTLVPGVLAVAAAFDALRLLLRSEFEGAIPSVLISVLLGILSWAVQRGLSGLETYRYRNFLKAIRAVLEIDNDSFDPSASYPFKRQEANDPTSLQSLQEADRLVSAAQNSWSDRDKLGNAVLLVGAALLESLEGRWILQESQGVGIEPVIEFDEPESAQAQVVKPTWWVFEAWSSGISLAAEFELFFEMRPVGDDKTDTFD